MKYSTIFTSDFIGSSGLSANARLLEVGCGEGELAMHLQQLGYKIVALDSDPAAVDAAKARGVDAHAVHWPTTMESKFDGVVFTRSLHHIHELDQAIEGALDCLADDGLLLIEDFDAAFSDGATLAWFGNLARILRAAGVEFSAHSYVAETLEAHTSTESLNPDPHHLHSATAIGDALARQAEIVRMEACPYHFRYFEAAGLDRELIEAIFASEQDLIRRAAIRGLGRRFVGRRVLA